MEGDFKEEVRGGRRIFLRDFSQTGAVFKALTVSLLSFLRFQEHVFF
jgi:hypothetical protein